MLRWNGECGQESIYHLIEEQGGGPNPGALGAGPYRERDLFAALPSQCQIGGTLPLGISSAQGDPLREKAFGSAQDLGTFQAGDHLVHHRTQRLDGIRGDDSTVIPVGWPGMGTLLTRARDRRSMTSTAPESIPIDSHDM